MDFNWHFCAEQPEQLVVIIDLNYQHQERSQRKRLTSRPKTILIVQGCGMLLSTPMAYYDSHED